MLTPLKKPNGTPLGVMVRHASKRNTVYPVTNRKRPYGDGGFMCNICIGTKHTHKTHHLWLGPDGGAIVSLAVLGELKAAGMPGLTVVGDTNRPPPTRIGKDEDPIDAQRNEDRTIHVFRALGSFGGQHWAQMRKKVSSG